VLGQFSLSSPRLGSCLQHHIAHSPRGALAMLRYGQGHRSVRGGGNRWDHPQLLWGHSEEMIAHKRRAKATVSSSEKLCLSKKELSWAGASAPTWGSSTAEQSICSFSSRNYLQTFLYNQGINKLLSSSTINSAKCQTSSYLCHPVQCISPGCLTRDVKALKDVQRCDQCRTCMWRWGAENKMTCEGRKRGMKLLLSDTVQL